MRYGWKVKGIPTYCACAEANSVDHSLICKLGSYTSMRHDSVTDPEAQILREVCRDVHIEPILLPINQNEFEKKVNTSNNSRLDISTRGVWNSCEKTVFDIRITHPTSQSYSDRPLSQICQQHEKDKYKQRSNSDWHRKSPFNPLVFTSGGMALECTNINKDYIYMEVAAGPPRMTRLE